MGNSIRFCVTLLLAGSMSACSEQSLIPLSSRLRFEPAVLEFPSAYADGELRRQHVNLLNDGQTSIDVEWNGPLPPFEADLPTRVAPGSTQVFISWTPAQPGHFSRLIQGHGSGDESPSLGLTAVARAIPPCIPSSTCATSSFDSALETCVEEPMADGTTCDSGSLCVVDARCEAGRCVGTARTCEDENRCTIDVCYPLTGCEFLPAPPCPGDGVCMEGVCDPTKGCGLQPRVDGAACGGSTTSCTEVSVCIEGLCVSRAPPDGYVCSEASPCESEGRCQNEVCVRGSNAQTLVPEWAYDSQAAGRPDAGVPPPQLHDFVMEPTGEMSLSGFFDVGSVLRANTPNAIISPLGNSRRCILWNTRYVCADYPAAPNGKVSALALDSGQTLWTFDIREERADFLMTAPVIFLSRLVVQDSDRLAALFEAYPRNASNDTQCRRYFLAVINASGELIQAQRVEDPLLAVCNHPHAYGVAADSVGNLFVSFSPSVSQQAPLVPDNTTLIMSYSRDGVFRWKRLNAGMRGGELAVARGLLYAEYASAVLDATSGQLSSSITGELGRAVISSSRLIPAPIAGMNTFSGYEAGTSQVRWSKALPNTWSFWSDQIRLAKWETSKGPRTIALTFVQGKSRTDLEEPIYAMYGFDVVTGAEAFICPLRIPSRTPPQLFEVANGSVGIMNGAVDGFGDPGCSKCDPPLAGTTGAFFSVPTRGISIAQEPWVGTFGGAGHDHHEN